MSQGIPQSVLQVNNFVDVLREQADVNREKRLYGFLKNGETLDQTYTFDELDARARAIAVHLQEKNLFGERALLLYPSSLEYLAAFFGCLYAGVTAVPVYPPQMGKPLSRISAIISDASPKAFLATSEIFESIESNMPELANAGHGKWIVTDQIGADAASLWKRPSIDGDTLSFLQYTSGSTGNPKGVMISHSNLLANQYSLSQLVGSHKDSVYVNWLPLFHDMGLIGAALQPVFYGFTSYLMAPFSFVQRPIRWLKAISDYQATHSVCPNFGFDLCNSRISDAEVAQLDLSSWEMACNGAEPVRMDSLNTFARKFAPAGLHPGILYPLYGMAESTLIISGWSPKEDIQHVHVNAQALENNLVEIVEAHHPAAHQLANCGHTDKDHEVCIVNPETCEPVSIHEVGEIWFKGPSVAKGYWGKDALTRETFHAYLPDGRGPFLRTGDLGFNIQEYLFITGRIKDLIIIRGKNHYPQDIEITGQKSHPALRADGGAAFSVDVQGQEALVVIFEIDRGMFKKVEPEDIFAAIRQAISSEHDLQVYEIKLVKRRSITKTSSGKVMRSACKQSYLQGELFEEASWTGTLGQEKAEGVDEPLLDRTEPKIKTSEEILTWILDWMSKKLSIPVSDIDPADSLNAYGTDSLMTAEFEEQISEFIGHKWPVMDYLITEPSIQEVADRGVEWAEDQLRG